MNVGVGMQGGGSQGGRGRSDWCINPVSLLNSIDWFIKVASKNV